MENEVVVMDGEETEIEDIDVSRVFTLYILDSDIEEQATIAKAGEDAHIEFDGPTLILLRHWQDAPDQVMKLRGGE